MIRSKAAPIWVSAATMAASARTPRYSRPLSLSPALDEVDDALVLEAGFRLKLDP